jgi:hypothetical protein
MRYIFSSVLIEGVTVEELSKKSGRKFIEKFKDLLTDEIEKHHSKGLKAIKITSLSTFNRDSLIIEFVIRVNPRYHEEISSTLRHALLTFDVRFTPFLLILILINSFFFASSSNKHLNMNNNSISIRSFERDRIKKKNVIISF